MVLNRWRREWPKVTKRAWFNSNTGGQWSPDPDAHLQMKTAPSALVLTMTRRSGLKRTPVMTPAWPRPMWLVTPSLYRHSFSTWSLPPVAKYCPSAVMSSVFSADDFDPSTSLISDPSNTSTDNRHESVNNSRFSIVCKNLL